MPALPRSVQFQYWEEPANQWAVHLSSLKDSGVDEIQTFLPWGLHESVQGIRDFSKASRLRVEKFLSLAHQVGITVRVTVGFPPRRESLPAWSLPLGEQSALVPAALWRGQHEDLSLTRLPSIHDEAFFGPFLEYLSDAFALLSLYRFPEGPVVGVHFDWGVFRRDLGLTAVPTFAMFLQERYPQAATINLRYQCTFRDFATATSAQGTRVMLDKRPWLAAFDYKFCRERMLEERAQGVLALNAVEPLLDLLSFDEEPAVYTAANAPWAVAMDDTVLESGVGPAHPFSPLGLANAQTAAVFRLWEFTAGCARQEQVPMVALRPGMDAPAPKVAVVAGRFLPQAQVRLLRQWVENGVEVFFPLGLPQYDENLATLEWKPPGLRFAAPSPSNPYVRWRLGLGSLAFAQAAANPEPSLWETLRAGCAAAEQGVAP